MKEKQPLPIAVDINPCQPRQPSWASHVTPAPCDTAITSILPAVTQPWHQKGWCLELVLHHCDMAVICRHSREKKKVMNNHYSKIWATSNAREEN